MSNFTRFFPARIYEDQKDVTPVMSVGIALATGNGRQVIAAVAGKRIRVMGWIAQSITAVGQHQFTDGSGGTALTDDHYSPLDTSGTKFDMPVIPSGYFETSTGNGLFADITTQNARLTVFYVLYTP
jgi:hypothetical protein